MSGSRDWLAYNITYLYYQTINMLFKFQAGTLTAQTAQWGKRWRGARKKDRVLSTCSVGGLLTRPIVAQNWVSLQSLQQGFMTGEFWGTFYLFGGNFNSTFHNVISDAFSVCQLPLLC